MDLKPNKVSKSELILEARHSKSIEASNKIRASLSPRLFIPRALRREFLTKDANNKVNTVKVKNSKSSEINTTLLINHDLTVKDQNKMGAKAIFRLIQGKYTKKANYKSVLNDNAFKKGRPKSAQKETIKIKKNISDGSVDVMERNCLDYNDMFLQYVGLTRRCETQTLTQNTVKTSEIVEETLAKRNLRKRRLSQNPSFLEQSTFSKRLKSKEQTKISGTHADLTFNNQRKSSLLKKSKTDKPISAVATHEREPCSPQCDNSTFTQQKVIKQRKTEDTIISKISTHIEKTTKSDTKVKDLKTIILREIFKKWLKPKPSNSPLETAKNNYIHVNLSSATNSPLPKISKNITRKLKNPTEHENNNQKDVEIELLIDVKSSPESNKQKSTKLTRRRNLEINSVENADNSKSSYSTSNALSSLNSTRVEIPQKTAKNCTNLLEPVVGIVSEDHLENKNKIDCKTKSQYSPHRSIQHTGELKIPENPSISSPATRSNNEQAKRYLRDCDVINLDDEPHTNDLTSRGEVLKNVKQSANNYITLADFSTNWRSSCRETLEICKNVPITAQYSISSHSQESFSSHPGCMIIFEDTPPRLPSDRNDNDLLSFHKNSTLVPEFQNIVRDTMSHLHTTSGQDLQINEDLISIENSVDEFFKYLLTTFKNIDEMEEQLKQDIVYINSGEFKKITSNTKRSHPVETIVTPKSSTIGCDTGSEIKNSTKDKKPEEIITILIQADQMPTKTITFKKSEIIIPTTGTEALIETEINLLTPPPEVIADETTQSIKDTTNLKSRKSDVTIISNIELPSLDLRNSLKPAAKLQENHQNQSNHNESQLAFISHLEIPTLDLQNQIQRVMQQCQGRTKSQINSESTANMPNTQTNLSTQDGGIQSYSNDILNFPASNQISQGIWNPTYTAVVSRETPYIMENYTENQINPIQNSIIPSSNRIQDLIRFRRIPKYDEGNSSRQLQSNNATDYHTSYLPPYNFLNHTSSQDKTDLCYIRKQKSRTKPNRNSRRNVYKTCNVLSNLSSQPITPSKCSVSVTNSSPIYTRAPHFNSSYWLQNSVYSVVGNNCQSRNHYQNLTRNQESHNPSYYAQPSLGNIYNEHALPNHSNFNSGLYFNNPVLFNNRPTFLNAPLRLDYSPYLVNKNTNNYQFDSNSLSSLASLSSQPYQNTVSPTIPNQNAGYNYNAYTSHFGPSEDGRMRSNT
ncbi:hypothetical protein DOY81_006615 [Sarcophaga bullata]|nr:hypothetical protein DOY81_006615 [Sarcophaga bullata]